MTLLNAPEYDEGKEKRKVGLLVGSGVLLAVVVVTCLGGYISGQWVVFFESAGRASGEFVL